MRARESFATQAATRAQVAAWIDSYNRERRHSTLGMQSPITYALVHARRAAPPPARRAAPPPARRAA
ncbi:integrase core domain-containing protein [Planosporangium sp. 12N6]|uniref:integrase core domain-containing protein n=1 Tax=Planosporangium spinosum TaxID=3402278 RepID=UPI003CF3E43E